MCPQRGLPAQTVPGVSSAAAAAAATCAGRHGRERGGDHPSSKLRTHMESHGPCCALTFVIPCVHPTSGVCKTLPTSRMTSAARTRGAAEAGHHPPCVCGGVCRVRCVYGVVCVCVWCVCGVVEVVVVEGGGGGERWGRRRARLFWFIWQTRNDEQNWIQKPDSLSQPSLMFWIPLASRCYFEEGRYGCHSSLGVLLPFPSFSLLSLYGSCCFSLLLLWVVLPSSTSFRVDSTFGCIPIFMYICICMYIQFTSISKIYIHKLNLWWTKLWEVYQRHARFRALNDTHASVHSCCVSFNTAQP